jgi:outer membrane lipoprotein-sorting protein
MLKHVTKILLGTLTTALVLAGCSSQIDVDKVVEKATKAQEKLKSYQATVSMTTGFNGKEEKSTYEEWMEKPDKHRIETSDGMTIVSNGETSWTYNEKTNVVTVNNEIENIQSDLPDRSQMMKEMIQDMADNNTVKYEGKEKVSGRQTIHLSLKPKKENQGMFGGGDVEVWLDKKTWMPLKMVSKSDGFNFSMEYESIEYNKKLDADVFNFTPPENAEVKQMEDMMPERLSIEEIRKKVDFKVPEMTELPQGFEFKEGMYEKEMNVVTLFYANDQQSMINLTISPESKYFSEDPEMKDSEKVTVDGNKGKLNEMNGMYLLTWKSGELSFGLMAQGNDMTKDSVLKMAGSIQ